jgi:anti-anti-sigma factor
MTLATISVETHDRVILARVAGEIDLSNARDLGAQILQAVPNDATGLVLDLAETRYLDSAGVRLVFDVAARLKHRRQTLAIASAEGTPVRRILELTDVTQVVALHSNGARALASLTPDGTEPSRAS